MKLLKYGCWAIFSISSASAGTLQCEDVAVKVSATAPCKATPADLNLTDAASDASTFSSLLNGLPEVLSSGTFTIRGRYCRPSAQVAKRAATLQILVHGITFTRHYWTGSDGDGSLIGSEYSWQEYAAAQGYATFAVEVAEQQFDTRGTSNLGEALTALDGSQEAPGVKVLVMALNGQQDQIFCGANSLDLIAGGHKGDCGTGDLSITAKSGNAFPNALPFEWHNVAETGHNNNFHRTAQSTFKAAHDFFARHGF
ncbi:hypothetical protein FDECE_16966 [Fusarium decemcellulare]|nr:hypothetical protein FDECE_16966 [Fusarium decemcellulare]